MCVLLHHISHTIISVITSNLRVVDLPLSYKAIQSTQQPIRLFRDALRIYGTFNGRLSSAIEVMEDIYYNLDSPLTSYFDQKMPLPNWFPISRSPLTEPKVTSVIVRVNQLNDWEAQWLDFRRYHTKPSGHSEGNEVVCFGLLPDYNPELDEEGPEHLLRCCEGERLRKKAASLLVKAQGEFLTIYDYISVVHP